jgi:outer membrane lipoprotein SlyB
LLPLEGSKIMKAKKDKVRSAFATARIRRIEHEAEAGASGALVGAAVGSAAGPPGAIAGAVIGAVAGAMAGSVIDAQATRRATHTRELDAEIGVSEGDIGAPNLKHPPGRPGR